MSIPLAFVMVCWYLLVKFAIYIFGIITNINSGHLFPDFDPLSGGLVSFFQSRSRRFFLKRQYLLRKRTVQSLVGLATTCWILVMMPYVTASFLPLIPKRNLRSEQELIWIFTSAPVFLLLLSAFVLENSFPVFRYVLRTGSGVMAIAASLNSSSPAGYWIEGDLRLLIQQQSWINMGIRSFPIRKTRQFLEGMEFRAGKCPQSGIICGVYRCIYFRARRLPGWARVGLVSIAFRNPHCTWASSCFFHGGGLPGFSSPIFPPGIIKKIPRCSTAYKREAVYVEKS